MLGVAVVGGGAALLVVMSRNVVHSALFLVVALLSVAGTFLLLGAAFLALAEAPRHGYDVLLAVERRTGGRLSPNPGTLYRAPDRLLSRGLLEAREEPVEGREPRRVGGQLRGHLGGRLPRPPPARGPLAEPRGHHRRPCRRHGSAPAPEDHDDHDHGGGLAAAG